MSEKAERFPQAGDETETNPNQSIFSDRNDGHFLRWLGAQGLAVDASDNEIIPAMEAYCDTYNTASIQD